ncbi:MAG: hypothetical protein WC615_01265 [Mucilaginibacter sp.]|jgi:hypothetical protein|uniref:hypothetical protein n=1 Tax=Mucilaginibacter sp. TaxID=1882438 RepID=UPI003564C187
MNIPQQKPARHFNFANSRLLIVNKVGDLVVNQNIDIKMISQIYTLCYIFSGFALPSRQSKITVNDADAGIYSDLWPDDSKFKSLIEPFLSTAPLSQMPFEDYDVIVTHPALEESLIRSLTAHFEQLKGQRYHQPELFSMLDLSAAEVMPLHLPPVSVLTERIQQSFLADEFTRLKEFKKELFEAYKGYPLADQEKPFNNLLKTIRATNQEKIGQAFHRILLLDDQRRKFYIGDSCFWLQNININIRRAFPGSDITVICRDEKKVESFNKIFGPSLDKSFKVAYQQWEDLDFKHFDLVLYESDITCNFLGYVTRHHDAKFRSLPIFSYFNKSVHDIKDHSEWNFKTIFNTTQPVGNSIDNIRSARINREFEIKMLKEELAAGEEWMEVQNVKADEKVIALLLSTSSVHKTLPYPAQLALIEHLTSSIQKKVLLFDENGTDLRSRLNNDLPAHVSGKIIIAEKLGIRMDMSLLANPRITAVFGPCTGMMHLANGIYRFIRNKNPGSRISPFMLVYTGNFAEFDIAYHPKHWWFNSLVKCAVLIRSSVSREAAFVKLNQLKADQFETCSLPLQEATPELFIDFLEREFRQFVNC